ncbi:MAG TPA: methyltransferase domain-containing protein [Pirellulales bacterium]|nr:methyltransferase domain-containing protein [Pirellulales bacterium]
MSDSPPWQPLELQLRGRYDVVESVLELAGRELRLVHPRSADELLDEQAFDQDGRIPYWAHIWPSSRLLAERLMRESGSGRRLLELGCGAGFCGLAAALAGFQTLATDYYSEALDFVQLNAQRNGIAQLATRMVDWRDYPRELVGFDWVVAADVLYEKPYADLLAAAVAQSLATGGQGLVTDPGRAGAKSFPDACLRHGLELVDYQQQIFVDAEHRTTIDFYYLRHQLRPR